MTAPRALVAGLGNIFYGDDAFGVAVIHELRRRPLPEHVRLLDAGVKALDLSYVLLEGFEVVLLVDAASRGKPPGSLFVLQLGDNAAVPTQLDAHGHRPEQIVQTARAWGARLSKVRLLGCEPASIEPAFEGALWSLSPEVNAAIEPAADLALGVVRDLLEAPCTN